MECQHNFIKYHGKVGKIPNFEAVLWNFFLLLIVIITIYYFQFYWIVLILLLSKGWKFDRVIYCTKCGLTKKIDKDD